MEKVTLVGLIFISFVTISCRQEESARIPAPVQRPAFLVILPGAREVVFQKSDGGERLSYLVDAAFPAENCIFLLDQKLTAHGWIQLQEDYLIPGMPLSNNPDVPDSIPRKFRLPADKTQRVWKVRADNPSEFCWETQYRNKVNDIVDILLQYDRKQPPDTTVSQSPKTTHLNVTQTLFRAAIAKRIRDAVINPAGQNKAPQEPQGDFDIYTR